MTTKKHNKAGEAVPMSLDQQCEALEQAYLETEGELEAVSIDNVTHDALVADGVVYRKCRSRTYWRGWWRLSGTS